MGREEEDEESQRDIRFLKGVETRKTTGNQEGEARKTQQEMMLWNERKKKNNAW